MGRFSLESMDSASFEKFDALVFGDGKVGKTTLAKTIPGDPTKILYIGLDPGYIALRGTKIQRLIIPEQDISQSGLDKIYEAILSHAPDFSWLFIDGINDAGEKVLAERKKVNTDGRKAYEEMGAYMSQWLKAVRDVGNLKKIFTTHMEEAKNDQGTVIRYGPDFPGRANRSDLNKLFDVIMCLRMVHEDSLGKVVRVLQCTKDSDPRYAVGDRTGCLDPIMPASIAAVMERVEESLPQLRNIATREAAIVNLVQLSKMNPAVKSAVVEFLREKSIKNPGLLNEEQLSELTARIKEREG